MYYMYIVFGKDYCIYCKLTKQLLDHHHIEYTYYDIDENYFNVVIDNWRSPPFWGTNYKKEWELIHKLKNYFEKFKENIFNNW